MQSNFADSLRAVLVHEGGYVDHPQDPGGATNKGVTLAVFQGYYGEDMGKEELKSITDEQVERIYKTGYWDKCKCDDLPGGVDYVVFDQAVNSGSGRSAKWLQTVIGVPADGGIGPQTLAAVGSKDAVDTINEMCDTRLEFMKNIRGGSMWETFGRGWQKRVDGVRAHGLQLAGGAAPAIVVDPEPDPEPVAPSVDYEIVRRGSRGEWVQKLQEALEVDADGIFGAGTEEALKAFQKEAGLTPDGIAGRNTYQALGLVA